jgi:hypothetical protein
LCHLYCAPAVECNLADVVLRAELLDELLDVAVVNDVALRRLQEALPLPEIVVDVVALDAEGDIIFRYPEERQNAVFILLVTGWEDQNECCDVCAAGQVKSAIAHTTFK